MKRISADTIEAVRRVSVYELAVQMGHHIKSVGNSWVTYCPNPHHVERNPHTYIHKHKGLFRCFGGGGCGCKGGDAITYYSWSKFGTWDPSYFLDCVVGIAEIMGIPVTYEDGMAVSDYAKRPSISPKPAAPRPAVENVEPQPDEVCDKVYRRFLDLCPLYEEHIQEWRMKRGYTNEEIVAIGLRSIPREYSEISRIVKTLLAEGYTLERVPGFTQKLRKNGDPQNPSHWYWSIAASGKYFIPVRNHKGQIVRMRVSTGRMDPKYMWFSSAPNIEYESDRVKMRKGGASSGAPLNIVPPYQVLKIWEPGDELTYHMYPDMVVCTEGEHKSYISSNILQKVIIGIPGAGNYKEVIPTLKRWGTKKLAIALDMDALLDKTKEAGRNQQVFEHLVEFSRQTLEEAGIEVVIWCWDPKDGKGLDDLLLNRKSPIEIDLRTRTRRPVTL